MTQKEQFIENMKNRTMQFVLDIIKLYQSLPNTGEFLIIKNQFLRSGSSVGSNYRASCRARSEREFFSKISIVVEEADETAFWMDTLIKSDLSNTSETKRLLNESIELTMIFSKARKSTGENIKGNK